LPVNWRIWPESTAFLIVFTALSKPAFVTCEGSSPFASMTSPIVSPNSVSSVTLPLSFGSVRSCSTESISPPTLSGL
jgi:hypothetical protein